MALGKFSKKSMCGSEAKLLSMMGMTGSFMLVELIVGNQTNSMALVADSFHMLSDVIAIIIAFVSVRMSPKRWKKNTYGWARAEVVGALVNAVFLFALCFSIFVEAIKRFIVIEPLQNPKLILIVGGIGLAINLVGLLIFGHHGHSHGDEGGLGHAHGDTGKEKHETDSDEESNHGKKKSKSHGHSHGAGDSGEQMNMAGVFLHILADALGSVVVMISASVMWLTDWEYKDYLDPVLSLVIVILICVSSWPLLRDSTLVLLNSIPPNINIKEIETGLVKLTEVTNIHEFHIWRLVGSRVIASVHLEVARPPKDICNVSTHMDIAKQIKEYFHSHGIHSTTIQLEYTDNKILDEGCKVMCPSPGGMKSCCVENSCCRNRVKKSTYDNPVIDIKTQF